MAEDRLPLPTLAPLGDLGLLIRFGSVLSDTANQQAIAFAQQLRADLPSGVMEIDPNLVSVLVKYDPAQVSFEQLAGELRLRLSVSADGAELSSPPKKHLVEVTFGGVDGPDLQSAAASLDLDVTAFIAAHNAAALRVLTTGFAPGFVYCGFHADALRLPRRTSVRAGVPPGSVLFAAGQTAVTSTTIPTGWHVIGRTDFRNFDAAVSPPTQLREGDLVQFTGGVA